MELPPDLYVWDTAFVVSEWLAGEWGGVEAAAYVKKSLFNLHLGYHLLVSYYYLFFIAKCVLHASISV